MSTYNFSLKYKSGRTNSDADGLSRRPHDNTELLSDAVKVICEAYLVKHDSCLYAANLVVTSAFQLTESTDSHVESSDISERDFQSTDLNTVDWAKEQANDLSIGKILPFVKSGYLPQKEELSENLPDVFKYLRHWKNLCLLDGIVYRNTVLNGEKFKQLVLPFRFRDLVFKYLHDDVGHQCQDRTLSLVRSKFFWPGFEQDIENRVRSCERCIKR